MSGLPDDIASLRAAYAKMEGMCREYMQRFSGAQAEVQLHLERAIEAEGEKTMLEIRLQHALAAQDIFEEALRHYAHASKLTPEQARKALTTVEAASYSLKRIPDADLNALEREFKRMDIRVTPGLHNELKVEHWMSRLIAASAQTEFDRSPGDHNYLEVRVFGLKAQEFVLTYQKAGRITPHEARKAAEARIMELEAKIESMRAENEEVHELRKIDKDLASRVRSHVGWLYDQLHGLVNEHRHVGHQELKNILAAWGGQRERPRGA